MGLDDALARHVPSDRRCVVPHARALGVLLRSIIVEREPIYRQQETVNGFAAGMFGITAEEMEHLGDDRIGRALDRLFDADRSALLTDVVLAVGRAFALKFDEFHNDSTTVSFCGAYRSARGREIRGHTAPAITYGHSKAHRPISSSSYSFSPWRLTAISPSRSAAATETPPTRAPTSRPGTRSAPWRGGQTSSMSPTLSCVRARTWTISIARAAASSPYCRAAAWRTNSSASGSKPTRPIGPWCGTAPILAAPMDRATAGSFLPR